MASSFWPWVSADRFSWVVHKFGGTSVANANCYKQVATILEDEHTIEARAGHVRLAAVVSAMGGVTDALLAVTDLATKHDSAYVHKFEDVLTRHETVITDLLGSTHARDSLVSAIRNDAKDIWDLLRAIFLTKSCSDFYQELIAGHGEIWSAQILNAYLRSLNRKSEWLDARQVLCVNDADKGWSVTPSVDWTMTQAKYNEWFQHKGRDAEVVVVTGFVASTTEGTPTTLKRNGSDYSASIFGSVFNARVITIWTDVDGVYSADPRKVPAAELIPELTYSEAVEFSFYGAKILHPKTMAPAVKKNIPIWIRNTFNPHCAGTKISREVSHAPENGDAMRAAVRGLCSIDNIALVTVHAMNLGTDDYTPLSIRNRLLNSLKNISVPLVMMAQSAPEHTVSFCVPEESGDVAKQTIEEHFRKEFMGQPSPHNVELQRGFSILTAVGDKINETPGIAARFFRALGGVNVNVLGIAQNGERIICVLLKRRDCPLALRTLHAAFKVSYRVVSVGVIGCGLVGGEFLSMVAANAARVLESEKIDLCIRGIMRSGRMALDRGGFGSNWKDYLETSSVPANIDAFVSHVASDEVHHAVIVDCTSSEDVASLYPAWLRRGIHIVTPNKKGVSGELSLYNAIREAAHPTPGAKAHFMHEATVGAGLPVIGTLKTLVDTGDRVVSIEGVLSGTLSYIFNNFCDPEKATVPFSHIVKEAKELGLTEPNPKDDLSGSDVARKVCILGRLSGHSVALSSVAVKPILPEELLATASGDEFMAKLPSFDAHFDALRKQAVSENKVLRFVGVVSSHGCSVELKAYEKNHAIANLGGCDNILAFTTQRYTRPLVVQGPGAGAAVTAAGVFGDLLFAVRSALSNV